MSDILLTMAKKASQDQSLIASLIDEYSRYKMVGWDQVARDLWIDQHRLAKLALCRRPKESNFEEEQIQIAEFVSVDSDRLGRFFEHINQQREKSFKKEAAQKQRWGVHRNAWAIAFVTLVAVLLSAFIFLRPEFSTATVVVTEGQASITKTDRILYYIPRQRQVMVPMGETVLVKAGDSIQTKENSIVQVHMFDGTTIELGENTELALSHLVTNEDQYQVRLQQATGKAFYQIKHLLGVADFFELNTPSTTISVRGTKFIVEVIDENTTVVTCIEGTVLVSWDDQEVELNAGDSVTANAERLNPKFQVPDLQLLPTTTQTTTQTSITPTQQVTPSVAATESVSGSGTDDESEEILPGGQIVDQKDDNVIEDEEDPDKNVRDPEHEDNRDGDKKPKKNR